MKKSEVYNSNSIDHFFRGAFSVDILLITYHDKKLKILLQEKKEIPFQNECGLPGELILPNEDVDEAMEKLMTSLVGQSNFYKKQLTTFSNINRHPLGRIVTFAYYGLIPFERLNQNLSSELKWCEISKRPKLILDHNDIFEKVLQHFREDLLSHAIVFHILPDKFILSDVIHVYEQTLDETFDVRNFRKKILSSGTIKPLGEFRKSKSHGGRPAELYELNTNKKKIVKDRIRFDLFN